MSVATFACAAALAFSPSMNVAPTLSANARSVREQPVVMLGAPQGRRAALLAIAAIPLAANADDALDAIVARNKAAAEAAKSDEALAAKAKAEEDGQNGQLVAGAAIGALVLAASAASFSTSGTTGNPKGVLLSHKAILATCAGTLSDTGAIVHNGKKVLTAETVFLAYLPLAHIMELAVEVTMFTVGATVGSVVGSKLAGWLFESAGLSAYAILQVSAAVLLANLGMYAIRARHSSRGLSHVEITSLGPLLYLWWLMEWPTANDAGITP